MDYDALLWRKYFRSEQAMRYYGEMVRLRAWKDKIIEFAAAFVSIGSGIIAVLFPQYWERLVPVLVALFPYLYYYKRRTDATALYTVAQTFQRHITKRWGKLCEEEKEGNRIMGDGELNGIIHQLEYDQTCLEAYISQHIPFTQDKKLAAAVYEETEKALVKQEE